MPSRCVMLASRFRKRSAETSLVLAQRLLLASPGSPPAVDRVRIRERPQPPLEHLVPQIGVEVGRRVECHRQRSLSAFRGPVGQRLDEPRDKRVIRLARDDRGLHSLYADVTGRGPDLAQEPPAVEQRASAFCGTMSKST